MKNSRHTFLLALCILLWAPSSSAISWPSVPQSWNSTAISNFFYRIWTDDSPTDASEASTAPESLESREISPRMPEQPVAPADEKKLYFSMPALPQFSIPAIVKDWARRAYEYASYAAKACQTGMKYAFEKTKTVAADIAASAKSMAASLSRKSTAAAEPTLKTKAEREQKSMLDQITPAQEATPSAPTELQQPKEAPTLGTNAELEQESTPNQAAPTHKEEPSEATEFPWSEEEIDEEEETPSPSSSMQARELVKKYAALLIAYAKAGAGHLGNAAQSAGSYASRAAAAAKRNSQATWAFALKKVPHIKNSSTPPLPQDNPNTSATLELTPEKNAEAAAQTSTTTTDTIQPKSTRSLRSAGSAMLTFAKKIFRISKKSPAPAQQPGQAAAPQAPLTWWQKKKAEINANQEAAKREYAKYKKKQAKDREHKKQKDAYGYFGFDEFNQGKGIAQDPFDDLTAGLDPATYFAQRTNIKTQADAVAAPTKKEAEIVFAREGGITSTAASRFFANLTGIPECDFTPRRLLTTALPSFVLGAFPDKTTDRLDPHIKSLHSAFYGLTNPPLAPNDAAQPPRAPNFNLDPVSDNELRAYSHNQANLDSLKGRLPNEIRYMRQNAINDYRNDEGRRIPQPPHPSSAYLNWRSLSVDQRRPLINAWQRAAAERQQQINTAVRAFRPDEATMRATALTRVNNDLARTRYPLTILGQQINNLDEVTPIERRLNMIGTLRKTLDFKMPLVGALCYVIAQCDAHKSILKGLRKSTIEEPLFLPALGAYLAYGFLDSTVTAVFDKLGVPDEISLEPLTNAVRPPRQIFENGLKIAVWVPLVIKIFNGIFNHSTELLTQAKKEFAEYPEAIGLKTGNDIPLEMRGQKYFIIDGKTHKSLGLIRLALIMGIKSFNKFMDMDEDASMNAQQKFIVKATINTILGLYLALSYSLTPMPEQRTYVLEAELAYLTPKTREALLQQGHSERIIKTMCYSYLTGSLSYQIKEPAKICINFMKRVADIAVKTACRNDNLMRELGARIGATTRADQRQLKQYFVATHESLSLEQKLQQTVCRWVLKENKTTPEMERFLSEKLNFATTTLETQNAPNPAAQPFTARADGLTQEDMTAIESATVEHAQCVLRDLYQNIRKHRVRIAA